MRFRRIAVSCCFTVVFLLCPFVSDAKTLHIPADAGSVKEAVEMAASGDEIIIDATEVDWVTQKGQFGSDGYRGEGGIVVKNKDITISGRSSEERAFIHGTLLYFGTHMPPAETDPKASLLWIEDATVVLRFVASYPSRSKYAIFSTAPQILFLNSAMADYFTAPIYVRSGSLIIEDSTIEHPIYSSTSIEIRNSSLICNTYILSKPYYSRTSDVAGFQIASASNIRVVVDHSQIGSSQFTYKAMELKQLTNSRVSIQNSRIVSGQYDTSNRFSSFYLPHSGTAAIYIKGCMGLSLNLENTVLQGGPGWHIDVGSDNPIAAPGGPGMCVDNSSILLQGGEIIGGQGGAGGEFYKGINAFPEIHAPSGSGGPGLSLSGSNVRYSHIKLFGGSGGPSVTSGGRTFPHGLPGEALVMDEFSTYQEIASLSDWSLH